MKPADLENLIKTRRSIRSWQDKEVPEGLLLQAVELATWAPNGGNQQNWRFYVIVNRDTIRAIADAVQDSAERIACWEEADKFSFITAGWKDRASFFWNAPAAIAVASSPYQSVVDKILAARAKKDNQARRMYRWRKLADSRIQSVASAIAYLLLVLHQNGLGAVWMTNPVQAKGEIEKILHVPPELDIIAFIPVGYAAGSPGTRGRRPLGEVCEVVR